MKNLIFKLLDWPSQSLHLNPIEILWSHLNFAAKNRRPSTKEELFDILVHTWNEIPQTVLSKLVDSMRSRCEAVIKSKGYPTKY